MAIPSRGFAGVGCLLLVSALAVSCTTAGTPVAEPTTTPSATVPAPTSATASAVPPPTVASDEDQIRQTMQAFQDAYNTENWAAYRELMCPSMREQFTGTVMDTLKKTRRDQGLTQATVNSATIDGDTAMVMIDFQNETLGEKELMWPFERSDGWKVCMHY
ncbi:MAG: nuclear transport factor 2 family protein [Mycobacterium sp.]